MGQWTATVDGQSLAALDGASNGKYLISIDASPMTGRVSYGIAGVNGQMTVNTGDLGVTIMAKFLIIAASPAAFWSTYRDLGVSFSSDGPYNITDPNGDNYTRCFLNPGTMHVVLQPQATGCATNQVFGEVEAIFTSFNPID